MNPENFIRAYEGALASQDWSQVRPLVMVVGVDCVRRENRY